MKNNKIYYKPELFINIVEVEDIMTVSSGSLFTIDNDASAFENPTEIL